MAQCKQSAQEFIQNAFSPCVAVLCSEDAEILCQKNNLSFVELVQPFCRLNSEAVLKIGANQSITVRNLRVSIKDMNAQLPQPALAKKLLNDSVSSCNYEATRTNIIKTRDNELQVPSSLPWFEAYRECFFDITYPSDHEFTKHFLACLFAVSTSHPNPNAELVKLTQLQHQMQHQSPGKFSKWFSPNTLNGYVLLHDLSASEQTYAESAFQSMKSAFPGSFCHLLQINSQAVSMNEQQLSLSENQEGAQLPDPWSQFLTRKVDQSDLSEYDNSPRTPQEDNIFPNKVSEGEPDLGISHITEEATEVTEDIMMPSQVETTLEEPLSPESNTSFSKLISEKSDKLSNLKMESVNEKDTPLAHFVNNSKIVWPQEIPKSQPHGLCLTVSDLDRIRIFIHEFVVRGLIPHVERQIKFLNETMATSRKKFHRSILNVTKKWLVGNKPGYQGPNVPSNTVVYSPEASELQVRKLGDLAFMFQHYELAYQAYHAAKQDFNSDQAWLYYAGALEMAALATFMLGVNSQRQYPFHYMDTAIGTYLNICKLTQFATRATLLSTECLKSKGLPSEAAIQFIKMTSEDSDLRSALLLEQAAYCFTAMQSVMIRKYAFHMVLAGHRFNKAGQRKHALRAYKQAYQVYKDRNWSLAEDHINFTIGRQSFNLKQLAQALQAFQNLLSENTQQPLAQQTTYLKEYLFVYNLINPAEIVESDETWHLPLPIIDSQATKVILGFVVTSSPKDDVISASSVSFEDEEDNDEQWFKLEELSVHQIQGSLPVIFRPSIQRLTWRTNNGHCPLAVVKEPITIEVLMKNPLGIPLVLNNVMLLWKFEAIDFDGDADAVLPSLTNEISTGAKSNIADEIINIQVIPSLVLEGNQARKVHLQLTPLQTGKLNVIGVGYYLGVSNVTNNIFQQGDSNGIEQQLTQSNDVTAQGKQYFRIQGPRLNQTKVEKASTTYAPDFRLESLIVPLMPSLQANFSNFPTSMLCGEIQQVMVEFQNVGPYSITELHVSSSVPHLFSFGSQLSSELYTQRASSACVYSELNGKSGETVVEIPVLQRVSRVPLPSTCQSALSSGATCTLPMWIRAPNNPGSQKIDFLFYYESSEGNSKMKNRVLRHSALIQVSNSLSVEAVAIRSHAKLASDEILSLAVAVEVENLNEVQDSNVVDINIMQISSASKYWILQPMSAATTEEIQVSPRETAHLCFRALHLQPHNIGVTERSVIFSNIAFANREIDSSATPCSDFCHRSRVRFPPLLDDVITSQSSDSNLPSVDNYLADCKAMERALQVRLTLIVLWKAFVIDRAGNRVTVMGQHHLFIDTINTLVSTTPEVKAAEEKPFRIVPDPEHPLPLPRPNPSAVVLTQLVQVSVLHPPQVVHEFSLNQTCPVSVTLIVYNCSHVTLHVVVDTSKPSESLPLAKGPPALGPPHLPTGYLSTYQASIATSFAWIGPTLSFISSLQPKETKRLVLRACFFAPGTYNVGGVYVGVRRMSAPEDPLTQQRPSPPSLLLVKSGDGGANAT